MSQLVGWCGSCGVALLVEHDVFARCVCDKVELLRAAFLILSCVLTLIASFPALGAP